MTSINHPLFTAIWISKTKIKVFPNPRIMARAMQAIESGELSANQFKSEMKVFRESIINWLKENFTKD